MKSILYLCGAILAANPALAGPVAGNGVLPGAPPARRSLWPRNYYPGCNADNVLRDLRNPTRSVGASSFCSTFLQPTTVVTSTVNIHYTVVVTATRTSTTSKTVTDTITQTSPIETCAAVPTSAVTCNYEAYGFGTVLISQTPNVDHVACHEKCLADPTCKSFQTETGGGGYCNLYNAPTAGNVEAAPGSGYFFYDRDCSQYLPAGCTPVTPKLLAVRSVAIPTYLATVPASRISSACSCFISSPDPTATSVVLVTSTLSATTTTTAIVDATVVKTNHVTAFVTGYTIATP